jgi:predicted DNA-binding transcriptional regulator AlpA
MTYRGEIPSLKVGGQTRYLRAAIEEWAAKRMEERHERPGTV